MPPSEATRSPQPRLRPHSGDLWPSRTSLNTDPTPGRLFAVCSSAGQTGTPTAGVVYLTWAPPPLPPCLGPLMIFTQEDKEASVFAETSRHDPLQPPFNMSFTWPLCRLPNHIRCTILVLTIGHCSALLQRDTDDIQSGHRQLIKQSLL